MRCITSHTSQTVVPTCITETATLSVKMRPDDLNILCFDVRYKSIIFIMIHVELIR